MPKRREMSEFEQTTQIVGRLRLNGMTLERGRGDEARGQHAKSGIGIIGHQEAVDERHPCHMIGKSVSRDLSQFLRVLSSLRSRIALFEWPQHKDPTGADHQPVAPAVADADVLGQARQDVIEGVGARSARTGHTLQIGVNRSSP